MAGVAGVWTELEPDWGEGGSQAGGLGRGLPFGPCGHGEETEAQRRYETHLTVATSEFRPAFPDSGLSRLRILQTFTHVFMWQKHGTCISI